MDTPKTITHIGLCAGYGGIELGLHRVIRNLRTVALCEVEAFCCANLVAKMEAGLMDAAPIWTDLKTFPWSEFRDRVDILTGGYPCQPFSAAGKRLGTEDPRHLWPFIADGIQILRPKLCFFENVEGHISLGLREVIGELESIGYKTAWGIFSAAEVGAPHQRKRVFIMAYDQRQRVKELGWQIAVEPQQHSFGNDGDDDCRKPCQFCGYEFDHELLGKYGCPNCEGEGCGELGDSSSEGHARTAWSSSECPQRKPIGYTSKSNGSIWPSRPGQPQHGWEPPRVVGHTNSPRPQEWQGQRGAGIQGIDSDGGEDAERQIEPALGRNAPRRLHGVDLAELSGLSHQELAEICEWMVRSDNRTDELRLLGNGVVPATAERAFRILMEELI